MDNPMDYSDDALQLTMDSEGCSLEAYYDAFGKVWTNGWGNTHGVIPNSTITHEQAVSDLRNNMQAAADVVNQAVEVDLTQGQFDALCDFVFNEGSGNFQKSTLLRLLNAGDYDGADHEFSKWIYSGGKILSGLVTRRKKEAAMFADPTDQA